MKVTIEIDNSDLIKIQKITGQKKKSSAVNHALADFLRMRMRFLLIEKALSGQTGYALTNDELEALEFYH